MLRILAFLTVWFFLAGTADAHAGFLAPVFGAIGTFLASGSVVANFLIGTALSLGASLIQKALAPKQKPSGIKSQVDVGGDNPLSFILGRYATAGQREYINTWGKSGKTPNAYLTQVISISDLPVGSLTGIWVDDTKVTIPDMSGTAPYDQGWPISEFAVKGNNFLWIRFHDGSQTAADSFLRSKFGSDADRPYTSDMIGRGVAYVVITCQFNQSLFPGIPSFIFETDGIKMYDVRKDSTAGGSGSHRWGDQSTYEVSDNPIVHAYNIIRGIYYGDQWVWGGQSTQAFQLPASNLMRAMNASDLAISLSGGGTEPQFRAGREITVDEQPLDVLEEYMAGCSGRLADAGGVYKVLVGAPGAAVYSFTDEQIVVTKGQSYDPFPGLESTYNGAQASYPEPSEKWAMKDAPAYYRADLEALDDKRRLVDGLKFPTVPYAVQVQRLLKAAVEDARRFRQHQFYLPPEAWLLEPNDVVSWTSTRNGYSEKKFLVTSIKGGSNFLQLVNLKEIDPADYDWTPATDEQAYSFAPVGVIAPPPQLMTGWNAVKYVIRDNLGNARRIAIQLFYDGDLDDVQFVRAQVRLAGETSLQFDGNSPYGDPGEAGAQKSSIISFASILPDTEYEVRGKFIPYSARSTLWSNESLDIDGDVVEGAWLTVTTDDIRLGTLDIYPITSEELAADIKRMRDFTGAGVRAALDGMQRLEKLLAEHSATGYDNTQLVRTELTASSEDIKAGYTKAILVATGPDSAIAQSLTTLTAELGTKADASTVVALQSTVSQQGGQITANSDAITQVNATVAKNSANGLFRAYVSSTQSGATATVALAATASSGAGNPSSAALYLNAKSDGTSEAVLAANRIMILNGSTLTALFQSGTTYLNKAVISGLTADNIDVSNLVASNAFIQNLTVGTSNIDSGAVSSFGFSGTDNDGSASVTVNTTNAYMVLVIGMCTASVVSSGGGAGFYDCSITRGSATLYSTSLNSLTNYKNSGAIIGVDTSPPSGSATYNIQQTGGATGGYGATTSFTTNVTAIVLKR